MTTKDKLEKIIKQALNKISPDTEIVFAINYPNEDKFGDYATNIAMVLSKTLKKNPIDVAEDFKKEILVITDIDKMIAKIDIVKPGFINFFLSNEYLKEQLEEINKVSSFGNTDFGKGKKVQIEFISANPTGPLTLANGRGGFLGDVLANVMIKSGYKVDREYLINDAGNQIITLGKSILAAGGVIDDDETYYRGEYISEWAKANKDEVEKYKDDAEGLGKHVAEYLFNNQIKPVIANGMKINFDNYFSEQSELHDKDKVSKVVEFLKDKKLTYENEDALWFKTTDYGDDKDRVLITSDGRFTYMATDLAYHLNKFERSYDRLINIWGADHGGYVDRMMAGVNALGYKGQLEIIIMQLVKLVSNGKEVRMSKRKGEYVTMEHLLELLPLDVVRWFFLMYNPNTHMLFDLDLAKDKSEKNPVYYVQYAHARIAGIINQCRGLKFSEYILNEDEIKYIKYLLRWPEILQEASQTYQVNVLTTYVTKLSELFHGYYQKYRVIEDEKINGERSELIVGYQKIISSVLDTLGISAPDKM